MVYFVDRFGLDVVGTIEDRPGIAPTAAHRTELAAAMKARGAKLVLVTTYYDDRLARVLADEVGGTVVMMPGDVGGDAASTGWFAFIDDLLRLHGGVR